MVAVCEVCTGTVFQLYVYDPAGDGLTVAVPLQAEHEAGVVDVVSVIADVVGHVAQVVVLKYNPAIHKLKQSPPVLQTNVEVACALATVVLTCSKFHQFQVIGSGVPFSVSEVTAI